MSYILDALKKAERERRVVRVPTIETLHGSPWERRRPWWTWVGAAVVLINAAALLIWFLRPPPAREVSVHSAPAPATPAPAAMDRPTAAAPTSPPPAAIDRPPASAPQADKLVQAAAKAPTVQPRPSPQVATSRQAPERTSQPVEARLPVSAASVPPLVEPGPSQTPGARARPAPTAPGKAVAAIPTPRVPPAPVPDKPASAPPVAASPAKPAERSTRPAPGFQELSPAEVEGMPKMSLQFLVYSDVPAERLVFINNQKYVEGQSIEGKVVVEAIAPDGAVLNYQGKRFKLHQ